MTATNPINRTSSTSGTTDASRTSHPSSTSTSSSTSGTSGAGRMSAAEAQWVRRHAWTAAMRKTYRSTPAILTMCPCQYGPCGHCTEERHDECPYDADPQWAASHADVCAGWITDADETVPNLGGSDSWRIWEAGIRHDGRCPCWRADHHGALKAQARQMTIFDYLPPTA